MSSLKIDEAVRILPQVKYNRAEALRQAGFSKASTRAGTTYACEVCQEARGVQKCHILSRKLDRALKSYVLDGIPYLKRNILYLCPNHHWAFDHNLLNGNELEKISPKIMYMVRAFDKLISVFISKLEPEQQRAYRNTRIEDVLRNKTIKNNFWRE